MGKVLHASGSGYFPFCIADGEQEDCPYTLEDAMKAYWRVRTWTFSASGIFEATDEPSYLAPFSSEITNITSRDIETGEPQTLEEGLVCDNFFVNNNTEDVEATIEFSGQAFKSGDFYDSGLYSGIIDNRVEPLEFFFAANNVSDFYISILGVSIPITMTYVNDNQETEFVITQGSATLTPTEWWSYGGTYDTATGEPL